MGRRVVSYSNSPPSAPDHSKPNPAGLPTGLQSKPDNSRHHRTPPARMVILSGLPLAPPMRAIRHHARGVQELRSLLRKYFPGFLDVFAEKCPPDLDSAVLAITPRPPPPSHPHPELEAGAIAEAAQRHGWRSRATTCHGTRAPGSRAGTRTANTPHRRRAARPARGPARSPPRALPRRRRTSPLALATQTDVGDGPASTHTAHPTRVGVPNYSRRDPPQPAIFSI